MKEKLHICAFNLCRVIVIREGKDENGHAFIDGRYSKTIKRFETPEEARKFVTEANFSNGF